MNFGFSATDFFTLGRFAYRLYQTFQHALGKCDLFTQDLYYFSKIIEQTGAALNSRSSALLTLSDGDII